MATNKSYVGIQVTLTSANTNYNLLALLQAIDAACPGVARELTIQAPTGNDAAGVLIGDGALSATRVGYILYPLEARTYRSDQMNVLLGNLYVRSAAATQKLNVEVMCS